MKWNRSNVSAIVGALKESTSLEDVSKIQTEVGELAASNVYVANALINMYAKLGNLLQARNIFYAMHSHTVVSWTTLIMAHAENNEEVKALSIFSQMKREKCAPNERTYVAVVRACTGLATKEEATKVGRESVKLGSLEKGMAVHSHALESGCVLDSFLGNSLLDMYFKCGSLLDGRRHFDTMASHSIVSWTTLVLGYADNGGEELAVELFHVLVEQGCPPNARTYVAVLKACSGLAGLEQGTRVDGKLVKPETLSKGTSLHFQAVKDGHGLDIFVSNSLVDMYGKCGSSENAQQVFDRMPAHGIVSCNALILGYARNGRGEIALEIFHRLVKEKRPTLTAGTFVAALKACISLATSEEAVASEDTRLLKVTSLEKGRYIHSQAANLGYELELSVGSTLVEMYSACGSMADACNVFWRLPARSTVSWNGLIHGYVQNDQSEEALKAFAQMQHEGCLPDSRSLVVALKACTILAVQEQEVGGRLVKALALKRGMGIHSLTGDAGHNKDVFVATSLIDMFVKCQSLEGACEIFQNVRVRDVVCWNSMIFGYADVDGERSMQLFAEMKAQGCQPDCSTYIAALKACASLGSLHKAASVHAEICQRGVESDEVLVNCLLDVYAKSGSMFHVDWTFSCLSRANLVAWNTLLAGHSRQGNAEEVLRLFKMMLEVDLKPNGVTLVCLLNACSHAGLVDEGGEMFDRMVRDFGIRRSIKHYHCMVDLLGRKNRLDEVISVVQTMPFEPNAVTWTTVLTACDKWKHIEAGRLAFTSCSQARLHDSGGAYVLMRNISVKS